MNGEDDTDTEFSFAQASEDEKGTEKAQRATEIV